MLGKGGKEYSRAEVYVRGRKDVVATFVRIRALGRTRT